MELRGERLATGQPHSDRLAEFVLRHVGEFPRLDAAATGVRTLDEAEVAAPVTRRAAGQRPIFETCGGALDFVANTAATLEQLNGLELSGGRIEEIRCYLTGRQVAAERFLVDRYHLRDKHGTTRTVFNAKININRDRGGPVYLGIRNEELRALPTWKAEPVEPLAAALRGSLPNRRVATGTAP